MALAKIEQVEVEDGDEFEVGWTDEVISANRFLNDKAVYVWVLTILRRPGL